MKKVLVTGAAGAVGSNVLKYLLSEGKYEITAVDLPNSKSTRSLKKYKKRINIVYADLTDSVITDGLVKDQDYIIHLASVNHVMSNIKKELCSLVDYKITENIIKSITFYNPKCSLLYASSTTVYKAGSEKVSVKNKPAVAAEDYFSNCKLKSENLIKKNISNYVIYRLPMILTKPSNNFFVYNGINKEEIETITDLDAAFAFASSLDHLDALNNKTFNVTGGSSCIINYKELINKVLLAYGVSFKYFSTLIFINKDYHGFVYEDSNELNKIIKYQNDSIVSYLTRLRRQSKKRIVQRYLAKVIVKMRKLSK